MEENRIPRPSIEQIMRTNEPSWEKAATLDREALTVTQKWMARGLTAFVLKNLKNERYVPDDFLEHFYEMSPIFTKRSTAGLFAKTALVSLVTDQVLWKSAEVFAQFLAIPEEERTVYVFAKGFFDEFSKVNLDKLQFAHVPNIQPSCIMYPKSVKDDDGDLLTEAYVATGETPAILCEKRTKFWEAILPIISGVSQVRAEVTPHVHKDSKKWVCFAYPVNNAENFGNTFIPRSTNPTDLVADAHENMPKIGGKDSQFTDADGNFQYPVKVEDSGYHSHNVVLFNSLAYIGSGQPDLREFRNQIKHRGNSTTKVVRADVGLTRSKVVLVGYGFKKEKLLSEGSWYSSDHLGWRYHGPGRSQLKLSYIRGSEKRWRKDDGDAQEGRV